MDYWRFDYCIVFPTFDSKEEHGRKCTQIFVIIICPKNRDPWKGGGCLLYGFKPVGRSFGDSWKFSPSLRKLVEIVKAHDGGALLLQGQRPVVDIDQKNPETESSRGLFWQWEMCFCYWFVQGVCFMVIADVSSLLWCDDVMLKISSLF